MKRYRLLLMKIWTKKDIASHNQLIIRRIEPLSIYFTSSELPLRWESPVIPGQLWRLVIISVGVTIISVSSAHRSYISFNLYLSSYSYNNLLIFVFSFLTNRSIKLFHFLYFIFVLFSFLFFFIFISLETSVNFQDYVYASNFF